MEEYATSDTTLIGALSCLRYKPERIQRSKENKSRVEFVFEDTQDLRQDILDIQKGEIKFSASDLAIELHAVRSKIKNYALTNS